MDLRKLATIVSGDRRPNAEFTSEQRAAICAARAAGASRREVADAFGTTRLETITDITSRFKTHHNLKSAQRTGRPRALSKREEARIVEACRKYPTETWAQIKERTRVLCSYATMRRVCHRHGLHKR
ncbi:hypothetical protein GGR56DRAFT_459989 [Xylariaceae sp. FL0804]|nr:hypothetical protein GGR56DRAFT_459989 [Xylariaceae sp. FL0804]